MSPLLFASMNMLWYLPPLVLAVSLVYSATRFESWTLIVRYTLRWSLYILSFLGGTSAFLYFIYLDVNPIWYGLVALVMLYWMFRPVGKPGSKDEKTAESKAAS